MWEYLLIQETNEKKLVETLNELGRQNWEAIGYTLGIGSFGKGHHFVLLKRQTAPPLR
jgi:hypothetical protein